MRASSPNTKGFGTPHTDSNRKDKRYGKRFRKDIEQTAGGSTQSTSQGICPKDRKRLRRGLSEASGGSENLPVHLQTGQEYNPESHPSITGVSATKNQLQKLGYLPGDEVWVKVNNVQPYKCKVTPDWGLQATKCINPIVDGNPLRHPDGNKVWKESDKCYSDGLGLFQSLAHKGKQIFIIPNHTSGTRIADVKKINCVFGETDGQSIRHQWGKLKWLALATGLVPSIVIYSGGKSLHFYYSLTEDIAPANWQRLQRKLILLFRSDPAIGNPNREMRLAGVSRGGKEVSLEFSSDHAYSANEFERCLDSLGYFPHGLGNERWLKARKLLKDKASGKKIRKLLAKTDEKLFPKPQINPQPRKFHYSGDTIPLEVCLTRDDKELISSGVSQGTTGRNPQGFKLAVNLVATARRLDELGIRHTNNGYQLLEEYCHRCNPPLPDREIQSLWRQADRGNPKASLTDEVILKRVSYWQWEQLPESKKQTRRKSKTTTNSNQSAQGDDSWKKYLKPIPELPNIGFHVRRKTKDELLLNFPSLETEHGQEWLQLRKFTPDHTINQQYFDWEPPKPGEGLAIRSGLGTGKSHWVNQKYLANPEDGAVIGGYRNVLLEQFCSNGHKLNGRHWNQIQADLKTNNELVLLADPQSRIAGAVDSWSYFCPHHFDAKKITFDEIESVAKHLHHSRTAVSYQREVVKQRVIDSLQNGDSFAILDGNLTDCTVEYFQKLSGRKITKVQNTYTGNRGKIYLYDGSSRHRQAQEGDVELGFASKVGEWFEFDEKGDDFSKLHNIMMELPPDVPIIIVSDSQSKCEAWDSKLSKKGRKIFRLDSTTSNTDLGKEFLRDPKAFILKYGINTVILSPSAESGVSIDMKKISDAEITETIETIESTMPRFFKYEFAFFCGVATTDTQVQFLGRNRDPETIKFVYCQNHSSLHKKIGFENLTSGQLQQAFAEYTLDCSKVSLTGLSDNEKLSLLHNVAMELAKKSLDAHYEFECRIFSKENFERKYPRLCLEYALRDSGWDVVTVRGREDDLSDLRKEQEEIQFKEAERTYVVETLSDSEADKVARKYDKTPDERRQVTKSRLLSRLPGFEDKTIQEQRKLSPAKAMEIASNHKIYEIDGVKAEEDGFAEKLKEVQKLAVQQQVETQEASTQQSTVDNTEQVRCDHTLENEGVKQAESQSKEGFDPVTQPPDISNKTSGVVSHPIKVTFEKPAFDPEFIHTVKNKDRNLISRIESQFLLLNPEAAKVLQQQRWYKKLSIFTDPEEPDCKKKIHLATYRSKWLQIYTLLEMGIGWFLNPENSWHKESPEVLEFWEKGKDSKRQRNIGVSAQGADPCQYLGKVLDKFGLKTECKRKKINGEVVRFYSLKEAKPLHQAIFESVAERINTKISEFVFDWKSVVENWGVSQAESQSIQSFEVVTQQTDISNKSSSDVSPQNQQTGLPKPEVQCTNKNEEISKTEFERLRRISEESEEKGHIFRSMLMGVKRITRLLYDQIMTEFAFASF
ncbi:MAG: hypothetical protein F6K41_04250 [Symploca sp. SIO3E6]|nr:hypothetical protein [Caldora sp. SIO3E6]